MNVKFVKDSLFNKYEFNCTLNGTTLVCITPQVSIADIPLFSSELLKLENNQSIATPYILYGNNLLLNGRRKKH
jgi:hypothetical protein